MGDYVAANLDGGELDDAFSVELDGEVAAVGNDGEAAGVDVGDEHRLGVGGVVPVDDGGGGGAGVDAGPGEVEGVIELTAVVRVVFREGLVGEGLAAGAAEAGPVAGAGELVVDGVIGPARIDEVVVAVGDIGRSDQHDLDGVGDEIDGAVENFLGGTVVDERSHCLILL